MQLPMHTYVGRSKTEKASEIKRSEKYPRSSCWKTNTGFVSDSQSTDESRKRVSEMFQILKS